MKSNRIPLLRLLSFYGCTIPIILVAIGTASIAQTELTLQQAVERAVQDNLALKRQRFDVQASEADIITAGLRPNPELWLNADMFSARMPILTPEEKQYGMTLSMPFELGGKREARIALAEKNRAASVLQIADAERQTAYEVIDHWFEAARAKLSLGHIGQARRLFDSIVAVNRVRLRNQVITPAELTRSQIAADQYAIQEDATRVGVARALRMLGRALGSAEPVDITTAFEFEFSPPPLDSAIRHAWMNRSDIIAARKEMERADVHQKLQQAYALPDLTVSASYIRQQGVPYYGVSVAFPLPLFSRNQGEIEKAHVLRQQAESGLQAIERQVAAEVELAYQEYQARGEALEKLGRVLQSAEAVQNTVAYAYRTGNTTILEFLDAERTWFDTRQSYNDALIDLRHSTVVLAMVSGFYFDR